MLTITDNITDSYTNFPDIIKIPIGTLKLLATLETYPHSRINEPLMNNHG